jgi:hypothetical protein
LGVCMSVEDAPGKWVADMKISLNNEDHGTVLGYLSHLAQWPWFSLPWSVPGVVALALPFLRRGLPAWSQIRVCYFWVAGGLVFFSTWAMQPIHYLLPLAVPLAVLEAVLCHRAMGMIRGGQAQNAVRRLGVLNLLTFLALPVLTAALIYRHALAGRPLAITAGLVLAAPAALALWWFRSRPERAFSLCIATSACCAAVFSGWIQPQNSHRESIAQFARELAAIVPETEAVYFQKIEDAMPFYANRDFAKIALPDEPAEAPRELQWMDHGYLVLSRHRYDDLANSLGTRFNVELLLDGPGQSEIERDKQWILIRLSPLLTSKRIEQNPR